MAKRVSGPSGRSKSNARRREEFGGRLEAWLSHDIWAQLERLAEHDGTKRDAVILAISDRFQRVFGRPKKK